MDFGPCTIMNNCLTLGVCWTHNNYNPSRFMSYNPFDDLPQAETGEAEEEKVQSSKRRRVEVNVDVAESKDDEGGGSANADDSTPTQQVEVASTLQTLKKHISNPKKQGKVFLLLFNLAEAELNESNSSDFFDTLNVFFAAEERRVEDSTEGGAAPSAPPELTSLVDRLITLCHSRSAAFSHAHIFQLQNWFLQYSVKNSLCCDDSFRFCKACRVVSELFDCSAVFPPTSTADYVDDLDEEGKVEGGDQVSDSAALALRRSRVAATLQCLTAALPLYTRSQWAKQPLDQLFATAAQRRLLLDADQREQLDCLTTNITLARRKASSGKPVQTVRAFNSTAHPLKTKKVGILR